MCVCVYSGISINKASTFKKPKTAFEYDQKTPISYFSST